MQMLFLSLDKVLSVFTFPLNHSFSSQKKTVSDVTVIRSSRADLYNFHVGIRTVFLLWN